MCLQKWKKIKITYYYVWSAKFCIGRANAHDRNSLKLISSFCSPCQRPGIPVVLNQFPAPGKNDLMANRTLILQPFSIWNWTCVCDEANFKWNGDQIWVLTISKKSYRFVLCWRNNYDTLFENLKRIWIY